MQGDQIVGTLKDFRSYEERNVAGVQQGLICKSLLTFKKNSAIVSL